MKSLVILSLLVFTQGAFALECKMTPDPVKTINRCDTKRTHGGEVNGEKVTIDGRVFELWAAPQTYEQLYLFKCTNACGKNVTLVSDLSWDCVAPQEIAAIGLADDWTPQTGDTCNEPASYARLQDKFDKFIKQKFDNEKSKPSGMPAPVPGINYWDGDSK